MDRIGLVGGNPLHGEIPISGAKNAALPLMIAALLTGDELVLKNVPDLADVRQLRKLLRNHGVHIEVAPHDPGHMGETIVFSPPAIADTCAPYELVSAMRASFWVIGPLLAREGEARVSLPGGCAIGSRPVDFFLTGLKALGAHIDIEEGYVVARAPRGGLQGAQVTFPFPSVGATHTILMAAVLARGTTTISNAAMEPEIVNLAQCLTAMGAKISGVGTRTLVVEGVEALHGAEIQIVPDRIEAGTFAMAGIMTGGDIVLRGARPEHFQAAIDLLRRTGAEIDCEPDLVRVRRSPGRILPQDIDIGTFPGFPTDLQAQYMALMCRADGTSHIRETIFENRFMHVAELMRFGADIHTDGQVATVHGVRELKGAQVMATDLRASVSLVIAGLAAEGETTINRIYHLDRGFEKLEEKLAACGADIHRLK